MTADPSAIWPDEWAEAEHSPRSASAAVTPRLSFRPDPKKAS